MTDAPQRSLFDRAILRPALRASFASSTRASSGTQPGDVRGRDRRRHHDGRLADPGLRRRAARRRRRAGLVHLHGRASGCGSRSSSHNLAEALAEGRGKAQAAALRAMRTETVARLRDGGEKPASELVQGRRRGRRGGRGDPGRRHRDRGHRLGRRVGHHRRVGARDPRGRRRPQRRHRRHARALRPDRGRDHAGAGPELPRPHDRARRGRRAAQDAERDRAQASCSPGLTLDLPRRRRDAAAVRRVRRHRRLDRDADRAARRR